MYVAIAVIIKMRGISRLIVDDETVNGLNSAVKPRTKAILVIFEPIALPMAVSGFPCKEAVAAIIISGAEEPIATIVKPIIIGEIPRLRANAEAPNTNLSALHTKMISESNKIKI